MHPFAQKSQDTTYHPFIHHLKQLIPFRVMAGVVGWAAGADPS